MLPKVPLGSRRAIRRAVEIPCQICTSHHDEPLDYRIADLAPHGLWIPTAEALRTGETVVVCFEPDAGWRAGELSVFAAVARVSTSRKKADPTVGMGLELLDLSSLQRALLERWLRSRTMPVPRRRRPVPRRRAWPLGDAPSSDPPPLRPDAPAGAANFRALGSAWR
jgi:hypothetical protein